jgi:hypothetical protein
MKQIIIGNKTFKTQTECENYTRSILTELGITDSVKFKNKEYFNFLFLLCKRHPHYFEKSNKLVDFQIYQDALNKRGLALNIVNNDNTYTEISWRICVSGKGKSQKTLFNSALRQCISYQIKEFRDASDLSYCRECNCLLYDKTLHIDHHEIQFIKLVEDFLDLNKEIITMPIEYDKKDITFETLFKDEDMWIGKLFEPYHLQNATLRVLCETCNLTRKKYNKQSAFQK